MKTWRFFGFIITCYFLQCTGESRNAKWDVLVTSKSYENTRLITESENPFQMLNTSKENPMFTKIACSKFCASQETCLGFNFFSTVTQYVCEFLAENFCSNRQRIALQIWPGGTIWDKLRPGDRKACLDQKLENNTASMCEIARPGCHSTVTSSTETSSTETSSTDSPNTVPLNRVPSSTVPSSTVTSSTVPTTTLPSTTITSSTFLSSTVTTSRVTTSRVTTSRVLSSTVTPSPVTLLDCNKCVQTCLNCQPFYSMNHVDFNCTLWPDGASNSPIFGYCCGNATFIAKRTVNLTTGLVWPDYRMKLSDMHRISKLNAHKTFEISLNSLSPAISYSANYENFFIDADGMLMNMSYVPSSGGDAFCLNGQPLTPSPWIETYSSCGSFWLLNSSLPSATMQCPGGDISMFGNVNINNSPKETGIRWPNVTVNDAILDCAEIKLK